MAKTKRRIQPSKPSIGPRGKTGATGPAGPPGRPGADHTKAIADLSGEVTQVMNRLSAHANQINTLAAQAADLAKELQIQLTRIAQIQAQLDRLANGA